MPRLLLTPNFYVDEFDRKARPSMGPAFAEARPYPKDWIKTRLLPLCEDLERIRTALREKIDPSAVIRIGSGYREPAYNKATPGTALKSQHMEGRAADIVVPQVPADKVHQLVLDLYRAKVLKNVHGLGIYPTFVHVDVRPVNGLVQWSGLRKDPD
jgi:uncharacterized protein YcbK (DUF882 family)